jgi:hypothetical protein
MAFELGPVLRFESRRVARRKGWYALRISVALAALGIITLFHFAFVWNVRYGTSPARAKQFLMPTFVGFLVLLHLATAMLVAPVEAASAFSRSRVRPLYSILLVTEISARRIVWETFAACLMPVCWLWLSLIPIDAFAISWWGVDPEQIAMIEEVTIGSILVCVAATAALSLWSKQAFLPLIVVYALSGAWLLGPDFLSNSPFSPSWIARASPFMLLVRKTNGTGPTTLSDTTLFAGVATLLAIILLEITVASFRRVVLRPATARRRARFARLRQLATASSLWLPAPSLDDNPVLWREWWRTRSSLGIRAFWLLYFLAAAAATVLCVHAFWSGQKIPDLVAVVGYEIGVGLLAVTVRSALIWSDEKTGGREGLDLLLATPLSATTILMGKWWSAYRDVVPLVFLPAVSAVILAQGADPFPSLSATLSTLSRMAVVIVILGQVLAYGAAFVSLGLFLATRLIRPARAAGLTLVLFAVVTLILPTVTEVAFMSSNRGLASGLGSGSPIAGPIQALMTLFRSPYFVSGIDVLPFSLTWIVLAGCTAWGLNRWTIRQFDRWMGRIASTPGASSVRKPPNDPHRSGRL